MFLKEYFMIKRTIYNSAICICAAIILIVTLLYSPRLLGSERFNVKNINEWTTENGIEKIPFALTQNNDGTSKISTVLPDTIEDDSYLCFWSYLSSVSAYIDGEEIYCHDNSDGSSFGAVAYSQWNYLQLPEGAQGKQLSIVFYSPYKDISFKLTEAMLGNISDIHNQLHRNYALSRFIEIALIWISLLFIVLGFLQNSNVRFKRYQLYAGTFILMFALYLCMGQKTMPLNIISPFTRGFICYFCMYGMSIPLTMYVREKVMRHTGKVLYCNLLILVQIAVMASAFLLHAFDVLDIHVMLLYAMVLLLVSIITAIVFSVGFYIRRRSYVAIFTMIAPIIMLAVILLEYFQFYYIGTYYFDTGVVCRLGAVMVVIIEVALYVYHIKIENKRLSKINEDNLNLELQVLTENIQPHFILNTIGAIRALISEEPKRASELLLDFSRYIRKKLEHKDYFKPVPFTEELEHIKTYLKLEEARFGDTIEVVYDIRDSAFRVLPLTVQPFVENAIKHGLFNAENGGRLTISSYEGIRCHIIEIMDNGIGFDADDIPAVLEKRKSVGLRSAIMRLENKMHATVTIHSRIGGKGTRVHIEIPNVRGDI